MAPEAGRRRGVPEVSVIVPAYNTAPYIGETLASVMGQTFSDFEVIVINDGSPDTPELERALEPFRDRIVYLVQENRGLSAARNLGIQAARGRYIALLDSDDAWEPEYLEAQVAELERDPALDVLYCNARIFGDTPRAGKTFMDICPSNEEVTFERLVTQECNVFVSVTARGEALRRAGLFDSTLRSVEDFDLWLRIVTGGGRIGYHRRVLVRFRKREGSLSSDRVWMGEHVLRVLEKAERTLALTPRERTILAARQAYFRALLDLEEGKRALVRGETAAAIGRLRAANSFLRTRKLALALWLLRLAPRLLLRAYTLRNRWALGTARSLSAF